MESLEKSHPSRFGETGQLFYKILGVKTDELVKFWK